MKVTRKGFFQSILGVGAAAAVAPKIHAESKPKRKASAALAPKPKQGIAVTLTEVEDCNVSRELIEIHSNSRFREYLPGQWTAEIKARGEMPADALRALTSGATVFLNIESKHGNHSFGSCVLVGCIPNRAADGKCWYELHARGA